MFAYIKALNSKSGVRVSFVFSLIAVLTVLSASLVITPDTAEAKGLNQVTGLWRTHAGDMVRFYTCGSQLCGKLIKTRSGQKLDKNNNNPKLRKRRIKGLTIIRSRKKAGPSKWVGTVYNVKDGKTYRGSLQLNSSRQATLTGCMGAGFCQSAIWRKISKTRVAAN